MIQEKSIVNIANMKHMQIKKIIPYQYHFKKTLTNHLVIY